MCITGPTPEGLGGGKKVQPPTSSTGTTPPPWVGIILTGLGGTGEKLPMPGSGPKAIGPGIMGNTPPSSGSALTMWPPGLPG